MRVANLVVQCLENEGVRWAFGLPGEENLDLLDALRDSNIRFLSTRHEGAAAFMADVHGRLTGRAGVCVATLGPGATNLVTGVADAFLDRAPLVAITAQADLSRVHKESHQYIDVLHMFEPITKWNARLETPGVVPEIIRKAFKVAQTEKPGSTHVELPEDVGEAEADGEPLPWQRTRRPSPDRPSVERAVELIQQAKQPIILAGNGVVRGGASDELARFSEELGIPVAHTFMSKGVVPWTSPLSLLTIGLQARDHVNRAFDEADLVLCVGYDFVEYDPKFWNPSGEHRIIHIDFTPAEVSAYYYTTVEIVADVRESLELIRGRVRGRKDTAFAEGIRREILAQLDAWREEETKGLKPQRILQDLREAMAPDDILISDVGAHKIWVGRFFRTLRPNTAIISNGLAAMGIALPGGIAAKLLHPDRHVVTVSGDGGFLMGVHELETAKRAGAATVNLVFRDGGYGSIRWKQERRFHRTIGVDFGNPDFLVLAEAFGIAGYRVEHAKDLPSVLQEALGLQGPSLVDIPIDYGESPFLGSSIGADGMARPSA